MKYIKKFIAFSFILFCGMSPIFADSISVSTSINAIDTPINNIFGIVKEIALIGIILGIMICAIAWAVPYLTKKERSGQNEDLMQFFMKLGVACLVIGACVFFPISIYEAIMGSQSTIKTGSDFILTTVLK